MDKKIEQWEGACLAAANIIRKKSEVGQLLFQKDILHDLIDKKVLDSGSDEQFVPFEAILKETMKRNEDLKELLDKEECPRYYSSRFMSEAYAKLLLRKERDPLFLISEIVRENSALYPRPIPLNTFINPPFELAQEQILSCLKKMSDQEEHRDIAQTVTSIGTIFLYSNRHLDSDYASMLAEWLDVGQFDNP